MSTLAFAPSSDRLKTLPAMRAAVLAGSVLFAAAIACAEDAGERLLNLVGDDVGLCVEIPKLEQHLPAIKESEFSKRLQQSTLYKAWLESGEAQKLKHSRESIEKHTGKSIHDLIRDVFGNSVVVAVYSSGSNQTAGVLLAEANDAQTLDAAINAWNQAEPQTTASLEHAGATYFSRTRMKTDSNPALPLFYAKLDRVFALSDHEDMIRKVLDLEAARKNVAAAGNAAAGAPGTLSLSKSATYQRSRKSLTGKDPVAIAYLNPRGWDSLFPNPDGGPREGQVLGRIWRRLESVAISLELQHGPVLEAVVHYSNDNVPARWKQAVERMQGKPEFLRRVPADAVAVISGRHDFSGLVNFIAKEAAAEVEQHRWESFRQISRGLLLGLDLFNDVLPALKPNWGAYAVPRVTTEKDNAIPLDALVAFELSPASASTENKASLRDALDNGLNTGLNLAAAYFNSTATKVPAVVRTAPRASSTVRWIEGLGCYRPAYALSSDYLAFASSPEVATKFLDTAAPAGARGPPRLDRCLHTYFPDDNQIIFFDVAALRKLLETHSAKLIAKTAAANSLSADDCAQRLARLIDVSNLVDSAFVSGHIDGNHLRLVLGGVVDDNGAAAGQSSAAR